MNEKDTRDVERDYACLITGELHGFQVAQKQFYVYPNTLAKILKVQQLVKELNINVLLIHLNPYIEAVRLSDKKKVECCKLLAVYTTPNTKECFLDTAAQKERAEFFVNTLAKEAVAMLLLYALTADRTEDIQKHFGIDKEREKMAKVMEVKAKNSKNSISYGGKSLFGTFFGQLHEMHYTDTEIIYERPYSFLRLMLADKVGSVIVNDEELQSIPTWAGGTLLVADDPKNSEAIADMLAKRGIDIN